MAAIIRNLAGRNIYDAIVDRAKSAGHGIVTGATCGLITAYPFCNEWRGNALSRWVLGLPYRDPLPVYSSILTGAFAGGLANAKPPRCFLGALRG